MLNGRVRIVALAVAGVLGGPLAVGAALPSALVDSTGPVVQFGVSPDLNCSARYEGDTVGEFFGETACITAIAAPEAIYAPATIPAGSSLTSVSAALVPVSQTTTGSGSAASPLAVTTVVRAGSLGLTQVDSYVVGTSRLQTSMRITNTSAAPITFDVFRAGDCFARDSDFGFGQMGPQSAACVSSVEARTARFVATRESAATQPDALTFQGFFGDLWGRIATFAPGGTRLDFDGTCRCAEEIDNAAGLQWRLTLPPGQEQTILSAIDFGPIAVPGGFGAPITGPRRQNAKAYVALGDSYSSGEGAGEQKSDSGYNYIRGTNVPGNRCHRSTNAYPHVLMGRLGLDASQYLDFRACSGATIEDLRGPNDPEHGNEAAQLDALGDDTQLATLTIGGNDADFAGIIKACATPAILSGDAARGCNITKQTAAESAYTALTAHTGPKSLLVVYQEVLGRIRVDGTLAVLGYPDFTPFGGTLGCETANRFSDAESIWLSGWIRRFNTAIEQQAARAGALYVDVDRLYQPLSAPSHRVCDRDEWVNGIRNGGAVESFHPNKLGHRANADAAYRRIYLGETNEALQTGSAVTFSTRQVPPGIALPVSSVVIRKVDRTPVPVEVVAGKTTIASLRYNGATPLLDLLDPAGNPVQIGSIDPAAEIWRGTGATSIRVGNTTVVEFRGMGAGRYTLNVSLPSDAPTDAGVLSSRFTTLTETNLPPIASIRATINAKRAARLSAPGSVDPEGGALAYRWSFGDKGTSSLPSTTHRYRKAGRFVATLDVTDPSGATTRQSLVVETRRQNIAGLKVRAYGRNRALVTLVCARPAVKACQARLRIVIRTKAGRRTVRLLDVSARPGRRVTAIERLPGTLRKRFAGTVSVSGLATDAAARVSGSRLTTSVKIGR